MAFLAVLALITFIGYSNNLSGSSMDSESYEGHLDIDPYDDLDDR